MIHSAEQSLPTCGGGGKLAPGLESPSLVTPGKTENVCVPILQCKYPGTDWSFWLLCSPSGPITVVTAKKCSDCLGESHVPPTPILAVAGTMMIVLHMPGLKSNSLKKGRS